VPPVLCRARCAARPRRARPRCAGRAVTVRGIAALLAVGVVAGACSSHSSSSSRATTGTTSATTPGSTTSTTAATTRSCPAGALAGSVTGSSGAAGTIEETIQLRNTSSSTCILGGYPGLQLLDAAGAQLATTVVRGGTYPFTDFAPSTVTLSPGSLSYFNLGYSDVPTGNQTVCPEASSMWVTPPNAYDHLTLTTTLAPCDNGTVVVSPVFGPGSSETQTTAP